MYASRSASSLAHLTSIVCESSSRRTCVDRDLTWMQPRTRRSRRHGKGGDRYAPGIQGSRRSVCDAFGPAGYILRVVIGGRQRARGLGILE